MADRQDRPSGVVGAGEVAEFDTAQDVKQDTLDAAVAAAAGTAASPAPSAIVLPGNPLLLVSEAVKQHFTLMDGKAHVEKMDSLRTPRVANHMFSYLPLILRMEPAFGFEVKYVLSSKTFRSAILVPALEAAYGDFLFETDLAADLGIERGKDSAVDPAQLSACVPELAELMEFADGRHLIPMIKNPYLIVLALPLETREFMAGAIEYAQQNDKLNFRTEEATSYPIMVDEVRSALTLDILLNHAKQVGQKQVRQYLDALKNLGQRSRG
jgi:hypothetical protein